MPTLATTNPTLAEVAKRLDPDGSIAPIVEILNQTNEILDYLPFFEGNLPTGHRTTIRTGLPQPTWRKLYGGVQPSRSKTAQVTDNTGMLEDYGEVDCALADLNGNTAAFRLSEDRAHIEGIGQEFVKTLFYGNEGSMPEAFTGLSPRFNNRNKSIAANGEHVLNGGGASTDNTSVWLCVFAEHTGHGIFPKGSKAGLSAQDKGQVTIENADGNGGRMEAYRTHYKWVPGITIRDWRYFVRIGNISVGALTKDASAGADLVDLMTQALELVPNLTSGRAVFCGNRTIRSYLRRQIKNHKNMNLTLETVAGKKVVHFDGVPFARCDGLINAEAVVPNS
ncbi:MAG TPA: hypothetical protein PK857_00555 [Hyphomicrobium sp.]|nr:hypothetical protein [Hyphomicrobium sp.]HRO48769.1 hypothetical protein [Hyphomicrobium sp.]